MNALFDRVTAIRHNILGLHLWGKKRNAEGRRIAHMGNLDTYFKNNKDIKDMFLERLYTTFSDDKERYFVPEVNSSNDDLIDIITDLQNVGFRFRGC